MNLNFKTRINGEDFFNLLCVLGGMPERKGNEFLISTGDYWDCVENLKLWSGDVRSAMVDNWQKEIEEAVAKTGKSVDVLIMWLQSVYAIHERNCVWMKFEIN